MSTGRLAGAVSALSFYDDNGQEFTGHFFVAAQPDNNNKVVAFTGLVADESQRDESLEDAKRIVACWNACEGIPTDELEPGEYEKHIIDTGNEIGRLTAERDELQREVNGKNAAIQRAHDRWFDAAAEHDKAKAINAELMNTLTQVRYWVANEAASIETSRAELAIIDDAIAKAKGGAA